MKTIKLVAVLVMAVWFVSCGGDENSKREQTISFDAPPPHNLSEGRFELQASATSGLPVTFCSSDPLTASVNGRTVTLRKAGSLNITASQSGNDSWYEAPDVVRRLIVSEDNNVEKQDQTITFNLNDTEWKSSYGVLTLEATASSGLPVTFTSSNPEIATIDGNILQLQDGRYVDFPITLTASQSGNSEYNAAPPVSKVISVTHDTH